MNTPEELEQAIQLTEKQWEVVQSYYDERIDDEFKNPTIHCAVLPLIEQAIANCRPKKSDSFEALKSLQGLLKDDITDEQASEMMNDR